MSVATEVHDKLDLSRVVRGSLDVLQRNWRSLLRPALLFLYLPGVAVGFFQPGVTPLGPGPTASFIALLVGFVALLLFARFEGGLIRLTIADLRAEPVSLDDAFQVGRARMWAMLGLYILTGLGVLVGLVLLIVPGVIAALAWNVVGPVLIEERRPVMQTFRRSAELTRGSRLNILLVMLLLLALEIIASLVLALLGAPFPALIGAALLAPLVSAAAAVVAGVVVAVIYDELREREARIAR
jgi:hypothetical protein